MERNFKNLFIWQEARKFINDIYAMMSDCRDYGFRDHIQTNLSPWPLARARTTTNKLQTIIESPIHTITQAPFPGKHLILTCPEHVEGPPKGAKALGTEL